MRKTSLLFGVLFSFVVPTLAQELSIAKAAANIDTSIPWLTDNYAPGDPGGPVPKLPKTDVDRGKLLDDALKRAADEKKLVFWYIPRIEGVQMYRPQMLDDYMRVTAFTNPMLANLIASRFVPLRMAVSKALFERTGIKNVDWIEPAIAILGPDGKILHHVDRIRTFNVDFFRATLLAVLAKHADLAPLPEAVTAAVDSAVADPASAFQASRNAVSAGDDAGAARIAESAMKNGVNDRVKAHGCFLMGALRRIARDGKGAAGYLDKASELAGDDEELKGIIATERGILALRGGDLTAAQSSFADASGMTSNPRRAEALYLLGITRTLNRGSAQAEQMFRRLVSEMPDSPYAAQAAANLMISRDTTPMGPAAHAFEDPFWPPEAAIAELRTNTALPRPPDQAEDAAKRTVAFILRHQNDNGGFQDSRYAYWSSPRILPNTWVAITAVALAGLSDWREADPKAIDDAIARGERYLFSAKNMAPGQNEECYAEAFKLLYLKRRLARLPQDSKEAAVARERLNKVSKSLTELQSEKGFFAHEYPNPFTTAGVLLSLKQAQDLGAAVPASVFELGAKGLKSVRGSDGSFSYGDGPPRTGEEAIKNAMARMPICERAILFGGNEQDTTAIDAAMENFWKFLPRFERVRECDFHTDGELAGFFFWHGMFFTSEALKALPAEKQAAHKKKLVEHVMSIGELDGSFIDSHEIGKSYGSGMALMVLRNCLEQGP